MFQNPWPQTVFVESGAHAHNAVLFSALIIDLPAEDHTLQYCC